MRMWRTAPSFPHWLNNNRAPTQYIMTPKYRLYTAQWIASETVKAKEKRAQSILRTLQNTYPTERTMLTYGNPVQLLVAVMLSAQCTDARVNMVTPSLFAKYKTARDFASASPSTFEKEIYSTGFYRAKTRNILATANILERNFDGKVPRTMQELLTLPGVARKTANVVLSNAYNIAEGIAVDTHVARTAQRLGLTASSDPKKIERDLMALFPSQSWASLSYYLIHLGRAACGARSPQCAVCPLRTMCPSARAMSPRSKARRAE